MLTRKVRGFIESKGLVSPAESVLVAVSGGADSVALLHVLSELHKDMGFRIEAAHLHHGIRPRAADEDAAFVRNLCKELCVVCHIEKADAPAFSRSAGLSVEEAARELRYKFLREVADAHGHTKIALGHTVNDQAETVLMHLIRGAGLLGVSGMKPISGTTSGHEGKTGTRSDRASDIVSTDEARITPSRTPRISFIRPFLKTKRAEIEEFLASREILYREDASNVDTTFLRNRVRHELMELLKEKYNPRIIEVLGSHATLFAQAEDYLSQIALEAYEDCLRSETTENIELELTTLVSYHTCVQSYVFREAYRRLCGSLKDLGFVHIASLVNLACSGQSGDSIDISSGTSAWLEGQSFWLGRTSNLRSESVTGPLFCISFEPGQEVRLTEIDLRITSEILRREALKHKFEEEQPGKGDAILEKDDFPKTGPEKAFFDLGELEPPFVLRNLRNGDRITPFGMDVPKKIQDVLVDLKVPRSIRKNVTALCDQNQILWLVGIRRSNAAPVTRHTRSVLSVEAEKL